MNVKKTWWVVGVIGAVWLSAVPAGAQQEPPRRGGRAAAGSGQALTPIELERWFDSYVLIQAQEAIKVTDAQFPRFLQRLKALQDTRRRNAQARRQALNAVAGLLKATPVDEAGVRERLKGLRENEVKAVDDLRKAYEALDEVLDPVQQARFRLFEETVERRKIDLLMRARERAGEAAKPSTAGIR
jgi:Spy/CpxP family protein refolding chaperone